VLAAEIAAQTQAPAEPQCVSTSRIGGRRSRPTRRTSPCGPRWRAATL